MSSSPVSIANTRATVRTGLSLGVTAAVAAATGGSNVAEKVALSWLTGQALNKASDVIARTVNR